MAERKRARQLPASSIGVLAWQQKFWLLLVEHALARRVGAPNLSVLDGFAAPAPTQYTVTTPDLLRSFRKYNTGKPYHRQVRPFGFMVMFQRANYVDAPTSLRVIAPFNRDPAKAARKAFDRDTEVSVGRAKLKTYAEALRTYYNHPEAKFQNGERADRGPVRRRHIIAKTVVHIGKEANKLDIQAAAGVDPEAQVEFHVDVARARRLKTIAIAVKRFGPSRIAREANLSRKHVAAIAGEAASASEAALSKVERAISSVAATGARQTADLARLLEYLRAECDRAGLRRVAGKLDISPGRLSRILSEQRPVSLELMRRIDCLS